MYTASEEVVSHSPPENEAKRASVKSTQVLFYLGSQLLASLHAFSLYLSVSFMWN